MDTLKSVLVPINKEGHRFIAIFAVVTLLLFLLTWPVLGWIGVVLTLWCVYFFRDPDRQVPTREGLIVSPADGVVQLIERAVPPEELGLGNDPRLRISVFLNVFNVHVNRVPLGGTVVKQVYRPGKFLNAALDKASEENERHAVHVRTEDGKDIVFVQIAGLVARRIICDLNDGQIVRSGERFGLIRFGSRTDIYLPDGVEPLVGVGQTMVGGETVIADMLAKNETPITVEVR
ncbi:phosphatidylserine decarboxylase [Sneathiella chinensis]|uniref:Phosphatidylserine decarboxylase proenzyme n=1 Tax=Sneathiella chinensis TaxID=349750 RepID=A0ABQ5U5E4_9PROT|nr:phosphatidylserine decarboxylase [Sneathiella chinensis]GLQ07073.1 phosphatidylserine decarboxylase proenzyme [Sneathiella chinensis]